MSMGIWRVFAPVLVLLAILMVCGEGSAQAMLREGGVLAVDGKPTFIVGLYENPADDAVLQQVANAGFNLVQAKADPADLDRLQRLGLKAWVNTGASLDLSQDRDVRAQVIRETADRLKDHPALLIWEAPDEYLWNCWYGSALEYLWSGEKGAMEKAIVDAAGEDAARKAALTVQMDQCSRLLDRTLWVRYDAAREAFWQAVGQPMPNPTMKTAAMADRAEAAGKGLTAGWELLRAVDPNHYRWQNHAPRNSVAAMALHNTAVEMAGCDIYPIPEGSTGHSDLAIKGGPAVGAYTLRMAEAAPGKCVAMVLQGFGWADILPDLKAKAEKAGLADELGRRPNWNETRFMAYDAIVNGATAIMYWGTAYIEKDSELWADLLRIARELKPLAPFLAAPPAISQPTATAAEVSGSVDRDDGVRLLLKETPEGAMLLVVNEHPSGVAYTVSGLPASLESKTLHMLGSDEDFTVANGAFNNGVGSYGVQVYATSRDYEVK